MRLAWLTDVHLNFVGSAKTMLYAARVAEQSDACVITGDIAEADSVVQLLSLFRRTYGKPVYFVLGNHDFYGGSFESVGAAIVRAFSPREWLRSGEIINIADGVQLCGADGWYDAQFGNPETSRVQLNDWFKIADLIAAREQGQLLPKLREIGQESAISAQETLSRTTAKRVIFATHVPPFAESSVYNGKQSDGEWLPWFTNKALGFALTDWATNNPEREIEVLCGHTHGRARYQAMPNLMVRTGFAEYGTPCVEMVLELPDGRVVT